MSYAFQDDYAMSALTNFASIECLCPLRGYSLQRACITTVLALLSVERADISVYLRGNLLGAVIDPYMSALGRYAGPALAGTRRLVWWLP